MLNEPYSQEVKEAVIECARLALLRCRFSAQTTGEWHENNRDIQRSFSFTPNVILEGFGIDCPDSILDFLLAKSEIPTPEQFYRIIAEHNRWSEP